MQQLGIDTGGTFTDFVWVDERGRLQIHKRLSTPRDPSSAIVEGIAHLDLPDPIGVVHGSTVATNALLERRGARTALITTAGFADVLAIGRQNRPDIYALEPRKPEPLVPAEWRFEVAERVNAAGEVQEALGLAELNAVLDQLDRQGIESVAISLLFSFLWPQHEQQIAEAVYERFANGRSIHVSLSSTILPEFREYERTSTTVINAYVAPLMSAYLSRLEKQLGSRRLTIMQSNGGIISAAGAGDEAARTVLSGPAGGVVGARYTAGVAGFEEIISFDMGGTSTDVALCPGHLPTTSDGTIADLPMHLPMIDIHTVGAGGGSLAYVDVGGALQVGPQSAGADPGPAAYGSEAADWQLTVQGMQIPYRVTTTDANLVLGRLDAAHFLGGTMALDEAAARRHLMLLAQALTLETAEEAAWQVIQVANATMERAIRRISVERGFDPRLFTLVAFGGAGPLHACELAQQLQIPRVLVPAVPGVLSALGMLAAAPAKDYSQTVMRAVEDEQLIPWLKTQFVNMEQKASADMREEGHLPQDLTFERLLDMRYEGQSHELTIPFAQQGLWRGFHAAHERRFGYQRPSASLEIVTLRLKAVAKRQPLALLSQPQAPQVERTRLTRLVKKVWFDGSPRETALVQRSALGPGATIEGPAVILQYDTTTVVPPQWRATVDSFGNSVIERT